MSVVNFIDPSAQIGEGTTVWHFAVVLANVRIGKNCSIGSGAEIGAGTTIGDGSRIGAHVFLPSNSKIGKGVFIGPGAVFTDDFYPAANQSYEAFPPALGDGCSIGAGAIVLPGRRVGIDALVGAGCIVTKHVPTRRIVRAVIRYSCTPMEGAT